MDPLDEVHVHVCGRALKGHGEVAHTISKAPEASDVCIGWCRLLVVAAPLLHRPISDCVVRREQHDAVLEEASGVWDKGADLPCSGAAPGR